MSKRLSIENERGSWSLIGLLAALVIGLLLVVVFLGPQLKGRSGAQTTAGQAIEKSHEVECQANLRQVRMAIDMYRAEHQAAPASVADLNIGTSNPDFFKCPVGHEDYVYDSQAAAIRCPHPGHESF
ncbi:MAG: hypothetical protein Q7T82_02065 [Armatimonadota bacterium]|nr:hypothetical protein [Armatimonadota bacterium]